MYETILCMQLPILYCVSLIMVTITNHIFINIVKMEYFLSVIFAMGYEKNVSFLVLPNLQKLKKKKKKNWTRLL